MIILDHIFCFIINQRWIDGNSVFDWWIEEYKHNIKGQMNLEDMLNE